MKNGIRANWGIYESDLFHFGGRVEYTGNVLSGSRRSVLEEAVVSLNGATCNVWMERFRHGNAAVVYFVHNGEIIRKEELGRFPQIRDFVGAYWDVCGSTDFMAEFFFFRRVRQALTALAQFICSFIAIFCLVMLLCEGFSLQYVCMLALASFLFSFFGSLYKYHRNMDLNTYKPKFAERSESDKSGE